MALIKKPIKILPFCAVTVTEKKLIKNVEKFLETQLSSIKEKYGPINFSKYTNYYENEMGKDLLKTYYYFNDVIKVDDFHKTKVQTNSFEEEFVKHNEILHPSMRPVNLDPGYFTEAKLVLFSAKDFAHRIYINNGIYAEVQLTYKKNSFQKNEWSYPDYITKDFLDFANNARSYLRIKLGRKN